MKTPTAAERAQLEQLDKDLLAAQMKQAYLVAAKVAQKLYDLQRKASGDDAPDTQRRKQTLASMLGVAGDYAGALALFKELLKTAEVQKGAESREVAMALLQMSGPYWQQNKLDELEPIYQRMLAISKKLDGDTSLPYAQQLLQYATLLSARNEYSAAQRAYEQCLKLHEAALKKDDPQLMGPMQLLAGMYWQTNQTAKAQAMYDRVIALSKTMPGATAATQAATLWGIASMYHYGGRDDLAGPLSKRAAAMLDGEIQRLEKANPDDPMISGLLGQLGFNYRAMNDLANAEKAFERSVALDDKRGAYSGWAGALAELKRAQGKPKEALALLEKAAAGLAKLAPTAANAYNTMIADVARELGDVPRAEKLILQYRADMEKQFGKKHPVYGLAQLSLATVYMHAGKLKEAEAALTDSLEIAEKDLSNVLRVGTESDHAVYFSRIKYQLDTAINFQVLFAPKVPSASRLALTTLLRRKGRVLDAAAASMATIRSKLSPDDKKLLDDLASARAKLAKLTVAGPSATGDAAEYAKEVTALEDQITKLELLVGKKSAAYRVVSQPIDLAGVQKIIPKDARLVEIVSYQPGDPRAAYAIAPKLAPRRYAAFVVGTTGDPTLVDLGEAAAIDAAIEKFRKAVANPDDDRAGELGNALYKLTMAKIAPALGGATNVLVAPDGALNVVPFSALVDDKKQFLIKTYTFTYLTSGRDLLRLNVKTKAQGGGVIFADPSFDATGGAAPAPAPGAPPASRGRRSADLKSVSWPALPGTAQEADAVEKTMTGLTVYRGSSATEATLKGVHGPRVLHLATHGFFLVDDAAPQVAAGGEASRTALAGPSNTVPTEAFENPLLRSGLALAGANKLASGDEDGILTAMEASGLDLWGTKLVVLSACETGVGKVTNGEGVYGLRRALVIAGAETLVMTLWQVDDLATRDLMTGFYKKLGSGAARSSALRDTQLEILSRDKYAHPYYWASFLPAGDNSPLKD
ncbi:MAG: CHAT domain-containing protein [Deltaproteobacteria bacterium]|nr:CHAT domain-containing protein [Deltaproteobacteria bacterium]